MRATILHLAFAGLGAREASSEAFADNDASKGVSRALGYEPNGTTWATRRGNPAMLTAWKLPRRRWEQSRRDDIQLTGVEACLPVLGLDRYPSQAVTGRHSLTIITWSAMTRTRKVQKVRRHFATKTASRRKQAAETCPWRMSGQAVNRESSRVLTGRPAGHGPQSASSAVAWTPRAEDLHVTCTRSA